MNDELAIRHLSYSACRTFCTSPYQFKRTYLEHQEFKSNLSFALGRAWHKGLEHFVMGTIDYIEEAVKEFEECAKEGLSDIDMKEEKDMKKFDKEFKALQDWLDIYPSVEKDWTPLIKPGEKTTELKVKLASPVEGGLPIVCVTDVWCSDGNPTDYKYVSRFSSDQEENKYYVQAWFNFHATKHIFGTCPDYFRISEWKKTKNRDGSPQNKDMVIIYKNKWMNKIDKFYADISAQIQETVRTGRWIPNPFQMLGGEDWKEYLNS